MQSLGFRGQVQSFGMNIVNCFGNYVFQSKS